MATNFPWWSRPGIHASDRLCSVQLCATPVRGVSSWFWRLRPGFLVCDFVPSAVASILPGSGVGPHSARYKVVDLVLIIDFCPLDAAAEGTAGGFVRRPHL